jgi:hypothetical protein
MKCSELVLTAGIIALALFSCAPPSPPAPAGGLPSTARLGPVCPVETFLAKVHFLKLMSPSFSTSLPGSTYQNEPPIDNTRVSPTIIQDLANAFNLAPPFFKSQLCDLTGIYIDPSDCKGYDASTCGELLDQQIADHTWGFRRYPSGEKYIGTSLGFWKNAGRAPPFDQFETRHLGAVLSTLSPNAAKDPRPPTHKPSSLPPNASATTSVLAALAHEYGHALWFDTFVIKLDGTPNPGGPANTDLFCSGNFYSQSWQNKVEVPATRWIALGDVRNAHRTEGINIDDLRSYLKQGSFPLAGEFLQKIYSSGEWASLLAAFSPDEDFVETYQLYVLLWANPNLRSPIEITGAAVRSYDVPGTWMDRTGLKNKMNCFGALPPPPGTAEPSARPVR